ncbi:tryptophan synthase subunit beta like protein [Ketobacter sp. MCCC 1A13808]|uniref:tryptophan synthase subunit beta like protein n=1 Tax=Ketobacter sp. MCCC 1A13808 TaxID=2602738 RepID=UPI000F212EC2|nr:tryptophan synthase subunit beta like protein [Ketobacter sp. MCCC 1A13808]MVF12711.1 tryptophan synthase subunit beta like protein [Ketobacter sp. MCCC 1A13808]RLP55497.1 MAG: tryptophan synthase subunit beta like protein [Ketobacter sp.]
MPFVKRDESGAIVAVCQQRDEYFSEEIENDDIQLKSFMYQLTQQQGLMGETDLGFIRVVEDLIDVLIAKNYIRFTDLPSEAQAKVRIRQTLRNKVTGQLDLLSDEDEGFF